MLREDCLEECRAPDRKRFDQRLDGRYWRNLGKREIGPRYGRDQDTPATFGYVPKAKGFRFDADGLSVNLQDCTCEKCSIVLHPTPERFRHVVGICLESLRQAGVLLLAEYRPVENPEEELNPCHYCLQPDEEDVEVVEAQLRDLFDRYTDLKTPNDDEIENARIEQAKFEQIFRIKRNVLQA